jgi:hypothetical protein
MPRFRPDHQKLKFIITYGRFLEQERKGEEEAAEQEREGRA